MKSYLFLVLDIFFALLAIPGAWFFWAIRRLGFIRLPYTKKILLMVGVVPIRRHYYEPLFHPGDLHSQLDRPRKLYINWNDDLQLDLLSMFKYQEEIIEIYRQKKSKYEFSFENNSFGPGDADYFYSFIRQKKPRKIIEIGSGNSTLLARLAIAKNKAEDPLYCCRHVCIEPYEFKWLETLPDIEVIRTRVELVDKEIFGGLASGDLLFIDSSHIIRPQGDVLSEILEILPALSPGVYIHFHDVFSPSDYPEEWVLGCLWYWNEQYLLEALLTGSNMFQVVGALNYLKAKYPSELSRSLPVFALNQSKCSLGSFYIQRI